MNLSSWMKELPDSVNLRHINIPGAHDSTARFCNFSLFSSCQNISVKDMLKIGIRVFDLRVNGEYMVHAFVKCRKSTFGKPLKIYEIINDILDFIDSNPTETVIVIFKNDGKIPGEECFKILADGIIKNTPDKWYLENHFPTLKEARGKIILINRINSTIGINFSQMPYQGGNKSYDQEIFFINDAEKVLLQDRYTLNSFKKWEKAVLPVLQNQKKYNGELIFNHLSCSGFPFIPKLNAVYINRNFFKYPLKKKGHYGFIMADSVNYDLSKKIINSNFEE